MEGNVVRSSAVVQQTRSYSCTRSFVLVDSRQLGERCFCLLSYFQPSLNYPSFAWSRVPPLCLVTTSAAAFRFCRLFSPALRFPRAHALVQISFPVEETAASSSEHFSSTNC
ncbi:hypothetical protein SJAG_06212 [Schizosaccharomyces japonicus yFS275]|uniref:Uncharacterized protein n=1 Tax=Schizosaccharomyces japonicus (strain yFS275 / FY16936) TaxID=402676 RepID=T0RSU8_SCHJY|nr:hypothetical protein SJAG_06212 [Schizosaccharomyces japonicus yFS275]EQC53015.1 hypothetical protein SJAG_06212 [Schizosaccharomyces japonicus yFS275]